MSNLQSITTTETEDEYIKLCSQIEALLNKMSISEIVRRMELPPDGVDHFHRKIVTLYLNSRVLKVNALNAGIAQE